MIKHIPQLLEAGITSLKIEGRMKTIYYVATVVRVYRQALDAYLKDPKNWTFQEDWLQELYKASHRPFTTGFYFNKPSKEDQIYEETYAPANMTSSGWWNTGIRKPKEPSFSSATDFITRTRWN